MARLHLEPYERRLVPRPVHRRAIPVLTEVAALVGSGLDEERDLLTARAECVRNDGCRVNRAAVRIAEGANGLVRELRQRRSRVDDLEPGLVGTEAATVDVRGRMAADLEAELDEPRDVVRLEIEGVPSQERLLVDAELRHEALTELPQQSIRKRRHDLRDDGRQRGPAGGPAGDRRLEALETHGVRQVAEHVVEHQPPVAQRAGDEEEHGAQPHAVSAREPPPRPAIGSRRRR